MNPIAQELNSVLEGTTASALLSDLGRRMYFPKGIVSQSTEAKQHASRFNATIGLAMRDGHAVELSPYHEMMPLLSPDEAVSYAPTSGDPALRKAWKSEMVKKNPGIDPDSVSDPLVVSGLTNGIGIISELFVDKEEKIVIPDMFWGNYRLIFEERREAKIVNFPFFTQAGGLNIDAFIDSVRKSAVDGTAMLLVNFPNNPTGYSPTEAEAEKLAESLVGLAEEGLKILAVMDDAYFGLFYEDGTYTRSLFDLLAGAHENILAIKVDGVTKEHCVWGFRIGFITVGAKGMTKAQYEALNKKIMGAIRSSVSNASRPAQSMLNRILGGAKYEEERAAFHTEMRTRFEKVRSIIDTHSDDPFLKPLPFNSGYFMSFEYTDGSAEELRLDLLHGKGIGTISIGDRYLRIAYSAVNLADLEALYEEIYESAARIAEK